MMYLLYSHCRLCWLITYLELSFTLFRYIDNETGRVMHDIVTKDSYGRQFEAIQHCFRSIGFTDEVRYPVAKPLLTFLKQPPVLLVLRLPLGCVNIQHATESLLEMNYESKTKHLEARTSHSSQFVLRQVHSHFCRIFFLCK